jgi:outer membrane biosynthesis protein TonB
LEQSLNCLHPKSTTIATEQQQQQEQQEQEQQQQQQQHVRSTVATIATINDDTTTTTTATAATTTTTITNKMALERYFFNVHNRLPAFTRTKKEKRDVEMAVLCTIVRVCREMYLD